MQSKQLSLQIEAEINKIPIFDTHEHLMYEYERRQQKIDFFHLFKHYASTDLISSGMDRAQFELLLDPDVNLEKKWKLFKPYWPHIENTGYSRTLLSALADLYGVEQINLEAIKKVTAAMHKNQQANFYHQVIIEKANIEFMLNDLDGMEANHISQTEPDAPYFLPVFRPDLLLDINTTDKLEQVQAKYDRHIHSLKDFTGIVDSIMEQRKDRLYGLKIGAAYFRRIDFELVTPHQAENSLIKVLKLNRYESFVDGLSAAIIKPFQDYMIHYCIVKAIELNIPVQIHTGLLESNLNDIRNSDPSYLTPVIIRYRQAKFDIFHAGYPFTDKLIAMIKMYPHCYFNLCWLAEVSIKLYMDILDRIIEILPSNKIFAFGGDYMFVEGCYGAQKNARKAVAAVLADRVMQGYFSPEQAVLFASKILNSNAKNTYKPD